MSTRLTEMGVSMVDSQSLKLLFSAMAVNDRISTYLSKRLKSRGYEAASVSVLNFLSQLECGVNYGSEIARSIGVSRQMVAKTVKELCRIGYLEQAEGVGRQKQILFTKLGEQLMADSRLLLAELDNELFDALGEAGVKETINRLDKVQELVAQIE